MAKFSEGPGQAVKEEAWRPFTSRGFFGGRFSIGTISHSCVFSGVSPQMVGFSPSFHHPKMIDPFLVGTPQWLLGKPSSLGNRHDIALDFLDGWLGFMWDVFFFGGVLGGGFWV